MRILHLVNGERISGPERVVEHLVGHARETNPKIIALIDGEFARSSPAVSLVRSRAKVDLSIVPSLAQRVRSGRFDIIHAHTPRANLVGRLAGRLVGVPVVCHVHSPTWAEGTSRTLNRARSWIDDTTAPLTSHHIAVSHWLKAELAARGYDPRRISVCHNGVDVTGIATSVAEYRHSDVRSQLQLPAHRLVFSMFAMFRPRKGADVLLRAFAQSSARRHAAILALVGGAYGEGERTYLDDLRDLATRLGISRAVRFTGFVPSIAPWLAATDVAVLPSRFGEGLPMALLEQLAAGIPTITTASPGNVEAVEHEVNALVVAPGSVGELAHAIDRLAEDRGMRLNLAARAASSAGKFDVSAMVDCVESAYAVALRKHRGGPQVRPPT